MILRHHLRHRQDLRDFILEFKFLKLGDIKIEENKADEGTPTKRALDGVAACQMSLNELRALPAVAAQLHAARIQLQTYRQALQAAYPSNLRLHTYAVVARGVLVLSSPTASGLEFISI